MKKLLYVIAFSFLLILIVSAFRSDPSSVVQARNSGNHRLVTPPLYVEGASIFYCTVVNLDSKPLEVDVKVFIQDGTNTCGFGPQILTPGVPLVQPCNSDIWLDINPVRYCEITYTGKPGVVLGTAQFDPPYAATVGVGPAVTAVEVP
jgi:hypothetical protein